MELKSLPLRSVVSPAGKLAGRDLIGQLLAKGAKASCDNLVRLLFAFPRQAQLAGMSKKNKNRRTNMIYCNRGRR